MLKERKDRVRKEEKATLQRLIQRSFYYFPDWWKGCLRDSVGKELDDTQLKLTSILMVIPILIFGLIAYAISGNLLLFPLGSALPGLLCLKLYKWSKMSQAARTIVNFPCPWCKRHFSSWNGFSGKEITCSNCGMRFSIPWSKHCSKVEIER